MSIQQQGHKPKMVWTYEHGWKPVEETPNIAQLTMGVYELPTGEIYVVKPNRDKTRMYAKRLVESPSDRLTETGTVVKFDFVYEKGAIYKIKPEHRMSIERGRELMIKYSRCIVCGRTLKVAGSILQGMGEVCKRAFNSEVSVNG